MTCYFWVADNFFSTIYDHESECVFDFLAEKGITLKQLAKLSENELNNYFYEYCEGLIKIDWN
jgi:hypothetical protein